MTHPVTNRWEGLLRRPDAFVAVVALLALLVPVFLHGNAIDICFRVLVLVAMSEAMNLLAGYAGLVSIGSAAFIGLGGYVLVETLNRAGVGVPLALLAAGCGGAILAAIVSPALFRTRGLYFSIGTLALSEILRLLIINVPWFGSAAGLFFRKDPPSFHVLYFYAVAVFIVAEVVFSLVSISRASLILRAMRDDEDVAVQMGVRTFRVKLAVFMVASAIMAMAGGIQAMRQGAVEPYGMFGITWSLNVAFAVIIGGLGYRLGAIAGVTFLLVLGEFFIAYPEINGALTGLLLVLAIRFAPKGLCGLAQSGFDRWSGRPSGRKAEAPQPRLPLGAPKGSNAR